MEKFLWFVMIPIFILGVSMTGDEGTLREGPELTPPPPPATHELEIKKVNNKWKVVLKSDSTKTTVHAKRGDKIVWTAVGTDAYFQFMDEYLVGKFTDFARAGTTKPLNIGNKAKDSINVYAVFCLTDKVFATGESPPMIIIE